MKIISEKYMYEKTSLAFTFVFTTKLVAINDILQNEPIFKTYEGTNKPKKIINDRNKPILL